MLEPGEVVSAASNVLGAELPDGRHVAVTFASVPSDGAALTRRLEMLVRTFAYSLDELSDQQRAGRAPLARSLHDELRGLRTRAQAIDAVVLDAHSPVVWGSARRRNSHRDFERTDELDEQLERLHASRLALVEAPAASPSQDVDPLDVPPPLESMPVLRDLTDDEALPASSLRALRAIRALPAVAQLRKGRHLHHMVREDDFGYVAQAFAAIYILVLVFEEPFDELRAERAIVEALPRIERLVLALPPLDPTPEPRANVVSLRRPRRR